MVLSDVGDDHYFSTVLKKHFDTRIAIFLGPRAKPLGFFTVYLLTLKSSSDKPAQNIEKRIL